MMRAAALARPLPPARGPRLTAARALVELDRLRAPAVLVVQRGRTAGAVERELLRRAVRLGLGDLPLADLLLAGVASLGPRSTLERVRRELARPGTGALLVGRAGQPPRGWIASDDLPRAALEAGPAAAAAGVHAAVRRALAPATLAALRRAGRAARAAGAEAWLVGGVVRDAVLGRGSADVDLLIDGDLRDVARRLGAVLHAGGAFLTARWDAGETAIDLAGARSERYAHPAALPRVAPAGIRLDLARRDFTINAIALRIGPGSPRLLDPFGGLADLARRRIRVLHGLSFLEDPTRALRAARLAERLSFALEPRTARLLAVALRRGAFERLSGPRIVRELARLFEETSLLAAVRRLEAWGLLRAFAPGIRSAPAAALRRLESHGSADGSPAPRWALALGLLLVGAGPAAARALIARLDAPRREATILRQAAHELPHVLRRLRREPAPRPSRVRSLAGRLRRDTLALAIAAAPASGRRALRLYRDVLADARPDIGARELIEAGIAPGPAISRGLAAALRAKLDGAAPTAAQQLRAALRAARRA